MITIIGLLDSMEKELGELFAGMLFPSVSGEMTGIHIWKQDIPLRHIDQEAAVREVCEEDIFPYCAIRAAAGEILCNPQTVLLSLTFGLYDNSVKNDGSIRILNLIERVSQRFLESHILDERYILSRTKPIKWELAKGDTFPFYYGVMEMEWERPSRTEREDDYA